MSSKNKRKKKNRVQRLAAAKRAAPSAERPDIHQAISSRTDANQEFLRHLGEGGDRFAALMAKAHTIDVHDEGLALEGTLTEDEHAELMEIASDKGREYGAEVEKLRDHLAELGEQVNPLSLLANVVLANVIGIQGEYYEPTHLGSETHVEYAAALLGSISRVSAQELPRASYEQVVDFMGTIHQIFSFARTANLGRHLGLVRAGDETAEVSYLGQARHLSVRGDSYPQHGIALARDLYEPFTEIMHSGIGFAIEDAITLANAAVDLMEENLNELLSSIANEVPALVRGAEPESDLSEEQIGEAAIAFLLHEQIVDALSFTSQDLADATGVAPDTVQAFLDLLSREMLNGDGKLPTPFASLSSSATPIARYGDRYLVAIPGRLVRELAVILDPPVTNLSSGFEKQKDRVVSRTATDLISKMLDNAPSYTHLFYEIEKGKAEGRAEVDGLVAYGRCLFIIEGKTGNLGPAERGSDLKRLKSRVEEHVVEAMEQAKRVRSSIISGEEVEFVDERGRPVVTFRAKDFDHYFLITPTLRLLGDLGPQLRRLKSLSLFEEGEFPFSIYINDLRVISEFVRTPLEFIHYVRWRMDLPLGDRVFVVDELDLFVSFLLREQFGRYLQATDGPIECIGSSSDLDDFYLGQEGRDRPRNKPRFFTPVRAIRDFLSSLGREQPDGWLDAGGTCLELSIQELVWIEWSLKNMPAVGDDSFQLAVLDGPAEGKAMPGADYNSLALVLMGRSVSPEDLRDDDRLDAALRDIERIVYVTTSLRGNPKIVWAESQSISVTARTREAP